MRLLTLLLLLGASSVPLSSHAAAVAPASISGLAEPVLVPRGSFALARLEGETLDSVKRKKGNGSSSGSSSGSDSDSDSGSDRKKKKKKPNPPQLPRYECDTGGAVSSTDVANALAEGKRELNNILTKGNRKIDRYPHPVGKGRVTALGLAGVVGGSTTNADLWEFPVQAGSTYLNANRLSPDSIRVFFKKDGTMIGVFSHPPAGPLANGDKGKAVDKRCTYFP